MQEVASTVMCNQLITAGNDSRIKAVVIRVDSPGALISALLLQCLHLLAPVIGTMSSENAMSLYSLPHFPSSACRYPPESAKYVKPMPKKVLL